MDKSSIAKGAGFLLLVFAAAAGGVFAGMYVREARQPEVRVRMPETKIHVGEAFPDVGLVSTAGEPAASSELVGGGGVVMFLRLDCKPCGDMVAHWQELQDEGELAGVTTVGITSDDRSLVEPYRRDHGLSFPIYLDPERTFIRDWEVRGTPYVVVVGPDGAVRQTFMAPQQIDVDEIRRQVGAA